MQILADVRQKCFFALMLLGGMAGLCEPHWDDQGVLFNFFCGLIVVIVASFSGSFAGFFAKNSYRFLRGNHDYAGEYSEGILMGSLAGAVVGIVVQMVVGAEPHPALGAGIGATVGGFLGTLPDETMLAYVITALYSSEEKSELAELLD